MKKPGEMVTGMRTFLQEVQVELKKCAWPTRPELIESTMIVIISVVILGTYVGLSDGIVMQILSLIIR
ncbi:MAG: preprotein translocase subunit SecE [Spartobacteria bacterium]|nr:preprotein translocase subunit SecE [Spartobacteria bacterium]